MWPYKSLRTEFAGTTIRGGTIQLPAASPALNSGNVVARYVSLYLGLSGFELPFRENLSEGSVLFVEYFLYSIKNRRVKMFNKNLVHAIIGGKDLDCGSAELSVNLGLTIGVLTRGHGSLLLDNASGPSVTLRQLGF